MSVWMIYNILIVFFIYSVTSQVRKSGQGYKEQTESECGYNKRYDDTEFNETTSQVTDCTWNEKECRSKL